MKVKEPESDHSDKDSKRPQLFLKERPGSRPGCRPVDFCFLVLERVWSLSVAKVQVCRLQACGPRASLWESPGKLLKNGDARAWPRPDGEPLT